MSALLEKLKKLKRYTFGIDAHGLAIKVAAVENADGIYLRRDDVLKMLTEADSSGVTVCQSCGGKLEYYIHRLGWIFGSCMRCTCCGKKWTDKAGPR